MTESATEAAGQNERLVMRDDGKYYRSQAIPGDINTVMYWVEFHDGKAADIPPNDIPEGAIVTDVTFEHDKREVRRKGNTFVTA